MFLMFFWSVYSAATTFDIRMIEMRVSEIVSGEINMSVVAASTQQSAVSPCVCVGSSYSCCTNHSNQCLPT